jgi:valyl-tRNA synthetase
MNRLCQGTDMIENKITLSKHYKPKSTEPGLQQIWHQSKIYHFNPNDSRPIYSIDTPPATVSGNLHLGHVYSYSHADFIARFWRMRGFNVFYPMGYDDNGIPTERLVEKELQIKATEIGRQNFIKKCLSVSAEAEKEYQELWQRLGLSIDWRYSYRTIDDQSRMISQQSFIDLVDKGLAYQKEAPTIWCPECQTAIAQAELNDMNRDSEFFTLKFFIESNNGGEFAPIATTRPELLPACVAVFVHPDDHRFQSLIGETLVVPLFGQRVNVLADSSADPNKGTGIVMCCTFGDSTDVAWWQTYNLDLIDSIDRSGRLTESAGEYAGLQIHEARQKITSDLEEDHLIVKREPTSQSVRVHERCDTPAEYIITRQWFIRVLEYKDRLLQAGEKINWHPSHMLSRYQAWVENLNWDWCISRQRYFGVPFPVWYCKECGEPIFAELEQLPIDPIDNPPPRPCSACGCDTGNPEVDVMDTWATSSMTPQIITRWLSDPVFNQNLFPMSLRPQAHEIIRTWAFYTIVKSQYHFNALPWKDALISGWGIAGEGMGKISKSRGGGPLSPMEMIAKYSADAVRYWAASTGPGKDTIISEEKIQTGSKLVTKLWNVARFSQRFTTPNRKINQDFLIKNMTPADRWILSRCQRLIQRVTELYLEYDYAEAKSETESLFWIFTDNYLEMAKQRLYDASHPKRSGAIYTLNILLLTFVKMFAPILPYITEQIYQALYINQSENLEKKGFKSIHTSAWPEYHPELVDIQAEDLGEMLVAIARVVRRYKSERNLSLGTEINRLQLSTGNPALATLLEDAIPDLSSITRALHIEIGEDIHPHYRKLEVSNQITAGIDISS